MGGSSSTANVSIENDTAIVNNTDISVDNENINNAIANTVVSSAKSCSAKINQLV